MRAVQPVHAVPGPYTHAVGSREIVTLPVASLLAGESPRSEGTDAAHIARLAEVETPLPPILVDRRSMRVIDGMHRLMAAVLKGVETIEAELFEGTQAEAYLRAVEANVTHGFPLSQADRRAAAARIIALHPQMSDRAIAQSAGLGTKTVADIRHRSSDAAPRLNARVGRDGKTRPLDASVGRSRAAEVLAAHPTASLREVARSAGVSPATVSDVRKRLERGEEPAPVRKSGAPRTRGRKRGSARPAPVRSDPPAVLVEKLLRDPFLRHSNEGRRLLQLLRCNAMETGAWPELVAAVPAHSVALVSQLAWQYADMWAVLAQELGEDGGPAQEEEAAAQSVIAT